MEPMLKEGEDRVIIVPPSFPLKKGDVAVYKKDGHYTMHRVIKSGKKGYVICGDNRTFLERDIKEEDIVGVLEAFYKGNRLVKCTDKEYIRYSDKMCHTLFFRRLAAKVKSIMKK